MPAIGPYTGIDLSDVSCILSAPKDRYHAAAGRYALELAASSYRFDVQPWLDAGFTDISMQVERRLFTGIRSGEQASVLQNMHNAVTSMWAHHLANAQGVFSQAAGLMTKVWEDQSGEALVMLKPLAGGQHLVLISFAGTGPKLHDWIPNLRFAKEQGFHGGFYSVVRQFMDNADKILFPSLGKKDGRPFTLADVIEEAKKPGSGFFFFAAGHSQGAAALQIWAHLMRSQGVLSSCLLGYGFAAPSVCDGDISSPGLPVILIANSDDVVPRVGLTRHLGTQYAYSADKGLIDSCYASLLQDPEYRQARALLNGIRGTQDALMMGVAFIYAMSYLSEEEVAAAIRPFLTHSALIFANQSAHALICLMRRYARQTYRDVAGHEPDRGALLPLARTLYRKLKSVPDYTTVVANAMRAPHALYPSDPSATPSAAYTYIAAQGYPRLARITDPA